MKTFDQWIENPAQNIDEGTFGFLNNKNADRNSHSITEFKQTPIVQPKNKEELEKIINDTIKAKGSNCDLNFIDTSLITDMSRLFMGSDFNGIISKWDVSNVTDMSGMFEESSFEGDLAEWDVSNVKDMSEMFYEAYGFNSDIANWNVSNVIYMQYMFAESGFNRNISKWNVSKNAFVYMMFDRTYLEENGTLPNWYKYHPNKN